MQPCYDAILEKYWFFIKKEVGSYCNKFTGFTSVFGIYDDLFDEACIAFLNKCSDLGVKSDTLDGFQLRSVKFEIHQAMRLYIWRHFNMRGNHNCSAIDYDRNGYISEADEETMFKSDDYSNCHVQEFLDLLDERKKSVLMLKMDGYMPEQIASKLNMCANTVRSDLQKVKDLYITYYGEPQAV